MRLIQHSNTPNTLSSDLLFRSYSQHYLPNRSINDIFQIGPGWLFLLGEFLGKANWLQSAVQPLNPYFQIIIRSFVSDHGRLKISYGTTNADFMEDSVLTDIVFSTEQRASHTCEITGRFGEFCQRDGLFRTLCYEEAVKLGFAPCDPHVENQWSRRARQHP
jgi:hypothetical protein